MCLCAFLRAQEKRARNVDISQQLKREPMSSPFASALLRAECVLLAVDESFEPLRRSWCCQASLWLKHRQFLRVLLLFLER